MLDKIKLLNLVQKRSKELEILSKEVKNISNDYRDAIKRYQHLQLPPNHVEKSILIEHEQDLRKKDTLLSNAENNMLAKQIEVQTLMSILEIMD